MDAACAACAATPGRFPAGVLGPSEFVRRYRVPHALHSMGFEAGPRRHCGESVRRGGRGGRRMEEEIVQSGEGKSLVRARRDERTLDARLHSSVRWRKKSKTIDGGVRTSRGGLRTGGSRALARAGGGRRGGVRVVDRRVARDRGSIGAGSRGGGTSRERAREEASGSRS